MDDQAHTILLLAGAIFFGLVVLGMFARAKIRIFLMGYVLMGIFSWLAAECLVRLGGVG